LYNLLKKLLMFWNFWNESTTFKVVKRVGFFNLDMKTLKTNLNYSEVQNEKSMIQPFALFSLFFDSFYTCNQLSISPNQKSL